MPNPESFGITYAPNQRAIAADARRETVQPGPTTYRQETNR